MIEIKNLNKSFGTLNLFNELNYKFTTGLNLIVGNSGSGKTTLLNIIATIQKATSGEVLINNINYNNQNEKIKSKLLSKNIGFIFQDFKIEENYTVSENIELALLISSKIKKKERNKLIEEVLKKVNLADKKNIKAKLLSGGEKQRVAIARALIKNPEIILADEPCGNLDKDNAKEIYKILNDIKKDKIIILVTHDISLIKNYDTLLDLSNV